MVVFKVDIRNFAFIDLESQPPISSDVKTPDAFSIAGKLVSLPLREDAQYFRVLHILQEGQHCPELPDGIRR